MWLNREDLAWQIRASSGGVAKQFFSEEGILQLE